MTSFRFVIFAFASLLVSVSAHSQAMLHPLPEISYEAAPVRILAIGNSFSEDAVEANLYDICSSQGEVVEIGNLYIPGCSIERHYRNVVEGKGEYRYRLIDSQGALTERQNVSLTEALSEGPWDYITFQQASHYSGQYATYEWLPQLIDYVRSEVGAGPEFVWHMTWAYAADSTNSGFEFYDRDQAQMYDAIVSTCLEVMTANPQLKVLIPCGTAIQNARAVLERGDELTRDGYHLELIVGRYIAALTWYEALFSPDVDKATLYRPADISDEEMEAIETAVAAAIQHPYQTTIITETVQ